jgi:hypothetical protein
VEVNLYIKGTDNMHHSLLKPSRMSASVKRSPVFKSAVSRGPRLLVQCAAVKIKFLIAIFKEGAGDVTSDSNVLHCG